MGFWLFKKRDDHIHKKLSELEHAMGHSFTNVKKDMHNASEWINHIKEKHHHHDNRINELEKKYVELAEKYEQLNIILAQDHEEEPERSIAIERVQSINRSDQAFMNVQSLTPAQKQVVLLLLGAGGPMDYESLAMKLHLNTVTIKRHINDIKRAGFPLDERVSVQTRRKVFSISESTKKNLLKQKVRV